MKKDVLFIQGSGEKGYEADAKLAASLQQALGEAYNVHYPPMQTNEAESDFGWPEQIGKEVSHTNSEVILVGHSLGASMLLKFLSENEIKNKIAGIYLISTPFWSGDEDWVKGLKLKEDFANNLPKNIPIFLYHCRDDEEIPFDHLALYRQKLPQATVREITSGGHQLNNDLAIIAKDIKSL
jgi:predicted alpha/beta hydrolase family esterase